MSDPSEQYTNIFYIAFKNRICKEFNNKLRKCDFFKASWALLKYSVFVK